jgi:hypothetical protein
MKIKKSKEFKPITLTLETEEEARLFYHMLNSPVGIPIKKYFENDYPTYHNWRDIRDDMWAVFDKVYVPKEYRYRKKKDEK